MDLNLVNKISGLAIHGFYDPSKKLVTVHFFNELDTSKPDVIAYLKPDMSWDIREIISEEAKLLPDREEVVIYHRPICMEISGSDFDKLVRAGLEALGKRTHGEDSILEDKDKMFRILKTNSYKEN